MTVNDAFDAAVIRGVANAGRAIAVELAGRHGLALVGVADLSGGAIRIRHALNAYATLRVTDRIAGTVALAATRREVYAAVAQAVTARRTILGLCALNAKLGRRLAELSACGAIDIARARDIGRRWPARSARSDGACVNRPRTAAGRAILPARGSDGASAAASAAPSSRSRARSDGAARASVHGAACRDTRRSSYRDDANKPKQRGPVRGMETSVNHKSLRDNGAVGSGILPIHRRTCRWQIQASGAILRKPTGPLAQPPRVAPLFDAIARR